MAQDFRIIVIGASLGGIDAIGQIVDALPADFDAAVFVVLHIGAHKSELPALLNRGSRLRAIHPGNGEPIRKGHIYVAPPDHHMVLEHGCIRLTKGPRENWARPAVDPLFRSAARCYGADVIGVILTGGLNDGTAGLFEIKQCGGVAIVQDPIEAAEPGMPRSALQHVAVDHCLRLQQIPPLLMTLVAAPNNGVVATDTVAGKTQTGSQEMDADNTLDDPVALTCPDCGGALRRSELGTLTQFRCHIGHVYTAEVMIAAQFAAMEWAIAAAMRSLNERGELCRQMADKSRDGDDPGPTLHWAQAMREARQRAGVLRDLLEQDWMHPDTFGHPAPSGG